MKIAADRWQKKSAVIVEAAIPPSIRGMIDIEGLFSYRLGTCPKCWLFLRFIKLLANAGWEGIVSYQLQTSKASSYICGECDLWKLLGFFPSKSAGCFHPKKWQNPRVVVERNSPLTIPESTVADPSEVLPLLGDLRISG